MEQEEIEARLTREYKAMPENLRQAALERDNFTCQKCGHKGISGSRRGQLQAHHDEPYRGGGEHELGNLITLCTSCHKKADRAQWVAGILKWQKSRGFKNVTEK